MRNKIVIWLIIGIILAAMAVCGLSLIRARAETTAQYFSNSIIMDGTYDWQDAMFSWNPALLLGYSIDTSNVYCVGAVRVDFSVFRCVEPYQWYYQPWDGKYYFTVAIDMPTLCGKPSVTLQPFLDVYNPTTGAHDRIYGHSEAVPFDWCYSESLPIIIK